MLNKNIDLLDPKKYIIVKNARVHNLKNLSLALPRNNFIVITGLSGSGKSSLAFDTIYAEGQRRYVESLSSYARQFIGRMNKPDVDYIKGISPAIAIEQKVNTRNPRSTVGTSTEVYDYLKLLYARIGKTYSPISGNIVKKHSVDDVVNFVHTFPNDTKIIIYAPINIKKNKSVLQEIKILLQKGFTRIRLKEDIYQIEDIIAQPSIIESFSKKSKKSEKISLEILVDRIVLNKNDEDNQTRIADSIENAFYEGEGRCFIEIITNSKKETAQFSNRFELDGITFEEPSTHLFSFNNPYGACKSCEGFGYVIGIDEDLVIPNKSLSIFEGAISCWRSEKMKEWNDALVMNAYKFNFPVHRSYYDLTTEERELLWSGNKYFEGLNRFFEYLEEQAYKIQYRVMLSRYRGKTLCKECKGSRLRKDAFYVKVGNKSINELVLLPIDQCLSFFKNLKLESLEQKIGKRLLLEINNRLEFLCNVGLGYLTLNRLSNTLSGGESQRINLATSLGSSLVGSLYILDEPSIGLHPRDTHRLIKVLKSLKSIGNTVIVVEHDEEIMRSADQLIDIGPLAGINGGKLVFQGSFDEILREEKSITARYLNKKETIEIPSSRRKASYFIKVQGIRENNLKNISVQFPLNVITVITGVSGSGKTSLVKKVLYPALKKMYSGYSEQTGLFDKIEGDINRINSVELIDQNPIGKSSRSNPVTYVKAFDEIRILFAEQSLAKSRKFKPSHFSFNIDGGRCEMCQGEGEVTIEMQFMADIHLVCETCGGKRFKDDVLEVRYENKNIAEILDMTVEEAVSFFSKENNNTEIKIVNKLNPLVAVGLGYVKLGQSSNTLSGGEAQRVKLASFLGKGKAQEHTLFIFDEPTTGLHFHDIKKLLIAFNSLIELGNSLIIIEHNPEVIKSSDWVIDLGPEGGEKGGNIIFEGTPEELIKCKESYTASFLKEKFI